MRRKLFTLCSALSLLLCVAVCVLWVRSFRSSDYVGREGGAGWVGLLSVSGVLRVERGGYRTGDTGWAFEAGAPGPLRVELEARDRAGPPWLRRLGFAYAHFAYDDRRQRRAAYLPHWAAAAAVAALPARWAAVALRSRRTRRRTLDGLCFAFGYDLRATPGRCPECGAATTGAAI